MSPLLGAIGDSSEYAYRGTLDDLPNDFNFTNITGAEPGIGYTTGPVTITGLNNKVRVSVSTGASLAINSGIFTSGPSFIRSGDILSVYTPTTQGTDADFSKIYNISATVGKTTKNWSVTTRDKDITPAPFTFTNSTNQELGITSTSNTITLSGLEPTVPSMAAITSGIGSFRKNGGAPGTASTVGNGDTLAVVLAGPIDYSKTNTTEITVGTYTTSYSVSTRPADTTVNQFIFTNFTNVAIGSAFDSNSITLSGADNNTELAPVPLTATITGGFLKVQRGSSVIRDFSVDPTTVFNGDILTVKVNSSINYSTTLGAKLTITGVNNTVGVASTFSVTTRPNISDTIVNQFQFVDKTNQRRGISTISDPITISGITTGADDLASIFLTNNADGGQFRIRRGGTVVRDFASTNSGVRNGDVVDLRITTSPASGGTVLTNVNIAGTDNSDINNILTQTRTDTWVVQSAVRNCPLSLPTFPTANNVEPSSLQSVTFTPISYDDDCNVIVNTSNPNSFVRVGVTTGNNLLVLPGVACTVFMTAGTFLENRSTTIRLTANNNIPTPNSTTSTWAVITRASTDPTATISVSPQSLSCGGQTVINWSTTNAVSATFSGFSGVGTQGSVVVSPTSSTTYSITARGPDGTTKTASAIVSVGTPTQAVLSANTTSVPFNGSVTLSWQTTNASFINSNFGQVAPAGQITLNNLKQSQTYTITAISSNGCANSQPASVAVNVAACTEDIFVDPVTSGVDITYTLANPGNGFNDYFTSLSGFAINNPSRSSSGGGGGTETFTSGPTIGSYGAGTCGGQTNPCIAFDQFNQGGSRSWVVPDGVNFIQVSISGAGGGGGGGGATTRGGRGGDGAATSIGVNVSPGQQVRYDVGSGGQGAPSCDSGNGVAAGPGGTTFAIFPDGSFAYATGGGGGSRSTNNTINGESGFSSPGGGLNSNSGGQGGTSGRIGTRAPFTCIGSRGGTGGSGSLTITYQRSVTIEAVTWSTLINSINNQFRSSFNRPANIDEMDFWIGQYINSTTPLSNITSSIASSGAFRSSTGAISFCGSRL